MKQSERLTIGLVLIGLAILALAGPIQFPDVFENFLFLGLGLVFLALYYFGHRSWAIYPGAFALPFGIVILLTVSGVDMNVWWPLFIASPGVSLLIIWSERRRHKKSDSGPVEPR